MAHNADPTIADFKGNTPMKVARNDTKEVLQKYLLAKNEAKQAAANPVPAVVTAAVNASRPFAGNLLFSSLFPITSLPHDLIRNHTSSHNLLNRMDTGKMAALKLEASVSQYEPPAGAVAQPEGAARSALRCALASCGKCDVVLKGCGRCRLVAYCTKEHQIADFKEHKNWCLGVKAAREDLEVVCDVTAQPNLRASATQRMGAPFDATVLVAIGAIEALLAAIPKETDPYALASSSPLPSLVPFSSNLPSLSLAANSLPS